MGAAGDVDFPHHRHPEQLDAVRADRALIPLLSQSIQLRTNIDRRTAERLAGEMQYLYDVLVHVALPCAPRGDRVAVTILPAWELEQFITVGAAARYRAGTVTWLKDYEGQVLLPDDLGAQSKQLFLHEVTHHLSWGCFPRMPAWLAEGLAGFFETMLIDSERVTFGRPPYLITSDPRAGGLGSSVLDGQRLTIVPMRTLPSLGSIIDLKDSWVTHDWRETAPRYAIAWALVDLLEAGAPDLKPRFTAYLGELRDSPVDPRVAFEKAFEGVPLQDRLTAYLHRERFPLWYAASHSLSADQAARNPRVREMSAGEGHLHLAWLGAPYPDEVHRERVRLHLAAAKQSPDTRDAAYLAAALALYFRRDLDGAAREVEEGLRGARDTAPFLEAQVEILIARKAMTTELEQAAERLRQVAATGGQFCTLAHVAMLNGDREAALELGARATQLAPRLLYCRPEAIAQQMSQ